MRLKRILSATALVGALATSPLAFADHFRRGDVERAPWRGADVIGATRLADGRGEVTFAVTPQMRRDGLALRADHPGVRILTVELGYSDGRVEGLRGGALRDAMAFDSNVVIQRGRPPGLRFVRVRYAVRTYEAPTLELIQIHDGDGYTTKADQRNRRDGWYEYQDEGQAPYEYDAPGYRRY